LKTYGVWVIVGFGVLTVVKGGLSIVDFFSSISFMDVGEVAFLGGLVTGIGVMACVWAGSRALRLRPEPVFRQAMQRVQADETVRSFMGQRIVPGSFRAYSLVPGGIRLSEEERELAEKNRKGVYKYLRPKRLQLFFQVNGSDGVNGMVSAEVEKTWRGEHAYNLLSVELEQKADGGGGERIVLEGPLDREIYKGVIKLR